MAEAGAGASAAGAAAPALPALAVLAALTRKADDDPATGGTTNTPRDGADGGGDATGADGAGGAAHHRGDLDGLRGVAVAMVVAGSSGLLRGGSCGIDVAFALAGYLLTGLLVAELAATGTVSVTHFWARRIRRLAPAACLAICATAIAVRSLCPRFKWQAVRDDLLAASLGVVNWRLAGADAGADAAHSWAHQFWSLSAAAQFFAVWPLALAAVVAVTPARLEWRGRLRVLLFFAMAVACASFAGAVATTSGNVAAAASTGYRFYGTHVRAWEMAAGGVLALMEARAATGESRWSMAVLGALRRAMWLAAPAAVGVLGTCAVMHDGAVSPVAAATPVAAALVLLHAGAPYGVQGNWVSRVLGSRPLAAFGSTAYALYLFHWPAIQAAHTRAALGTGAVGASTAAVHWNVAAGVAIALVTAVVTTATVEGCIRRSRWLAASWLRSLALGVLAAGAASYVAYAALPTAAAAAAAAAPSVSPATVAARGSPSPSPLPVWQQEPALTHRCLAPLESTIAMPGCGALGNPAGSARFALLGDSHAAMWVAGMDFAATHYSYALAAPPKVDCPFLLGRPGGSVRHDAATKRWLPYAACDVYNAVLLDELRAGGRLNGVFLSRDFEAVQASHNREEYAAALSATMDALADVTSDVVFMRDAPHVPPATVACAHAYRAAAEAAAGGEQPSSDPNPSAGAKVAPLGPDRPCSIPTADLLRTADEEPWTVERELVASRQGKAPRIHFLDVMNGLMCTPTVCQTLTEAGVPIMADPRHLSGYFALYHADWLMGAMRYVLVVAAEADAAAAAAAAPPPSPPPAGA